MKKNKMFLNCVKDSRFIVLTENNQCYWKDNFSEARDLTYILDVEKVKYVVAGIFKTNINCER